MALLSAPLQWYREISVGDAALGEQGNNSLSTVSHGAQDVTYQGTVV